jgi:hypothetical protein
VALLNPQRILCVNQALKRTIFDRVDDPPKVRFHLLGPFGAVERLASIGQRDNRHCVGSEVGPAVRIRFAPAASPLRT